MHKRIRKLRKALHLTQQEFAERISVKRNTVTTYEMGRNEPIPPVIQLICREFHVNKEWLCTGKGPMFLPDPKNLFRALSEEYGLSPSESILIEKFVRLDRPARENILQWFAGGDGIGSALL